MTVWAFAELLGLNKRLTDDFSELLVVWWWWESFVSVLGVAKFLDFAALDSELVVFLDDVEIEDADEASVSFRLLSSCVRGTLKPCFRRLLVGLLMVLLS